MKRLCVIGNVFLGVMLSFSCGVVGNIEGGPKDSTVPVFLRALPDSAGLRVDVKNKKILLYFNEFIRINNPSNILINPLPRKNMPIISEDLRRIVIKYDTLLERNVTYSFDFSNEIGDLNENNRINKFYYLFSTGRIIDTLKFRGRILNAVTGLPDSISRAFLYPAKGFNDSTVMHKKAFYTAKANQQGYFEFQHIRPGTYYAFALQDQDQNFKYSGTSESFDFLDSPIKVPQSDSLGSVFFTSAKAVKPKGNISRKRIGNKWLLDYIAPDPVQVPQRPMKIIFHDSITQIDSTKIRLYDTTGFKDSLSAYQNEYIMSMRVEKSSENEKNTRLLINMDLDFAQPYVLILDSGWVRDTNYVTRKSDTLKLEMLALKEYRILKVFCDSCQVKNPALDLFYGGKLLYTLHAQDGAFTSPYLRSGNYDIHLYEDFNLNKKQDIIDYRKKQHAERTFLLNQNSINLPPIALDGSKQNSLIYEQHIRTKAF